MRSQPRIQGTAADADLPVGLIGPADQLGGLRAWSERCREPTAAKDERYPHLFPEFPGCDIDRGLHTTLVFTARRPPPGRPGRPGTSSWTSVSGPAA